MTWFYLGLAAFFVALFIAFCGLASLGDGPCMVGYFPHEAPNGWRVHDDSERVKCYSGEVVDFEPLDPR